MQDIFDAMFFGLSEILKKPTLQYAVVSGSVVSVVWILIGLYYWDGIVAFSSSVLSMLPFSMLRSNGAWMFSTFLFLQTILVTFAMLFTLFGNVIAQKDSKHYTAFTIFVALFSLVFWGVIWFFQHQYIYAQFLKLLTWLPFETVEKTLSFLIAFYLIYTAIIISMIFISSFTALNLLQKISEKYFPYDTFHDENEFKVVKKTLKDTAVFIVISIFSFPLLFIPVLNFVLLVGLWMWLMKDTISYDTAAFVYGKNFQQKLKTYKHGIWFLTFIGSLFHFIPVFNLFAPYFTQLSMFYFFVQKRATEI